MSRIQRRGSRLRYTTQNQHPVHSSKRVRFIDDGEVEWAPSSTTAIQALEFGNTGENRIALSLYPTPNEADINELTEAWDLHPVLVEDLLHARQRPKLERYRDVLLVVVRSALYLDAVEEVELSEFHILVRPGSIAVLCQDHRWIDGTDGQRFAESISDGSLKQHQMLLKDPQLLRLGVEAVLYRILDEIVDGYVPVLHGLGIDKEQIERQVFSGDAAVTERIYRLSQEVIDVQHATASLLEVVRSLGAGVKKYPVPDELETYLQDVTDHLTRANTQALEYRDALSQILNVNATLVAQRQNEDMKKISGWAAILFAPTLIAAIYGMNFDNMPELHWAFGYPAAVLFMVLFAAALYGVFKWRKWF
ncbi:magnesium and cobalt transport protein CorA [Glutamicibacter sp. JC586]|uniref:magnesium and cobalt transport protein CorA n=1 Tax=Glutamicibacter sp. JC586 TaxID=2590552 RepID=UPI00135C092E|nr:magnesium and cobalt transport protein CorA [Glutamicibacter sp. JC586]